LNTILVYSFGVTVSWCLGPGATTTMLVGDTSKDVCNDPCLSAAGCIMAVMVDVT